VVFQQLFSPPGARYRNAIETWAMAFVLIKNLHDELHQQLKEQAERHHRSLNKELIAIIETALRRPDTPDLPETVPLRKPITQETLDHAREEGRA